MKTSFYTGHGFLPAAIVQYRHVYLYMLIEVMVRPLPFPVLNELGKMTFVG